MVADGGVATLPRIEPEVVNQFTSSRVSARDLAIEANGNPTVRVIEAVDGQLVTGCLNLPARVDSGRIVADVNRDILKLVVVNRYREASPAIALIKNCGLERGALASSVAHDSHNVIAVGASDDDLALAINLVMEAGGD